MPRWWPQPLIVFTHAPVLAQPREGALHHPAPRQNLKAPAWEKPLPVDLPTLLRPFFCPYPCHLLRRRLRTTMHDLDTQPELLLYPLFAPALVTRVHPQMREARKALAGGLQQQLDPVWSGTLALCTFFQDQALGVHQHV